MAAHKLAGGSTWYDHGTAPWETDPTKWDVAPNAEGGMQAVKKNVWLDKVLPAVILGGMAAPWAASGIGALSGSGAAAGGSSAAADVASTMAVPGTVGTGGMMASPLARYGIPAVGDFLTSMFQTSKDSAENKRQRDFLAQQAELERNQRAQFQQQDTALDESKLDPWRGTMSQVGDASKLDRLANSTYSPVQVSRGQRGNIQTSGGATYNKSPELIAAARAAAAMILSGGGQAPSMTNPANYGRTGITPLAPPPRPPRYTMPADRLGSVDPWAA